MKKIQKEIQVRNPQGLHARPAALFVQIVSKYDVNVTVEKNGDRVNGKSIMGILTLGAQQNSLVGIEIEGDAADQVMQELEALLTQEET
ncbi:MAG: HPr family phosphocarrier protein [Candidatus Omnitrophica bacterium]|nr:HPr family phosphocarrier protein [Candidatus Omnitrophota bacterium]